MSPSFYLLTVASEKVATVERVLSRLLKHCAGGPLTPLRANEYVLSRPALLEIRRGRTEAETLKVLRRVPGVEAVRRIRGDEVAEYLRTRTNLAPEKGFTRAQPAWAAGDYAWNLKAVRLPQAWEAHQAKPDAQPLAEIKVGHIDTGYTEHPALGPWRNHFSPIVRADLGINYLDDEQSSPMDPMPPAGNPGHGTRTMSMLTGSNTQAGFYGATPGVTVVSFRITDSVVINQQHLDRAILHAINDNGCDVISISLGDPCFPVSAMGKALDYAYDRGVIVVAAAGNVTSEVTYPARYSRTIGVGGNTHEGERLIPWSGSSRGVYVDISAPADDIFRADVKLSDEGGYIYGYGGGGDGTSYATVHVSGTAAIWLAYHRRERLREHYEHGWQIIAAFFKLMQETATVPPDGWDKNLYGAGILNAGDLLKADLPDPGELRPDFFEAAEAFR